MVRTSNELAPRPPVGGERGQAEAANRELVLMSYHSGRDRGVLLGPKRALLKGGEPCRKQ